MTQRQRMRRVESGVTRDRNREKLRERLSKEKKKIQSELHQVENQLQAYGLGFGICGGIGGGRQQNVIKMRAKCEQNVIKMFEFEFILSYY